RAQEARLPDRRRPRVALAQDGRGVLLQEGMKGKPETPVRIERLPASRVISPRSRPRAEVKAHDAGEDRLEVVGVDLDRVGEVGVDEPVDQDDRGEPDHGQEGQPGLKVLIPVGELFVLVAEELGQQETEVEAAEEYGDEEEELPAGGNLELTRMH